ncbi:MAG TPA: GTP cyclohydrolase I FolE [Myxococcota bacterium]|jgi:GTP cyclohydrolase I|nr:GTP cyclohydrolase I FolE [Myxococcota bacterium]
MSEIADPIESYVTSLLKELGEDPGRSGLERTPERVARALRFFTTGYEQDPRDILNGALFEVSYDEMVIVKDIEFYSLCEHHLLPFFGRIHVAYIPNGKVLGLSKIPRLVEIFARRLQVQERMTVSIAETLEELLQPKGVAVVAEAIHLCMMMRGVRQQNASAITSSIRGQFERDPKTRSELMDLLRHRRESFA